MAGDAPVSRARAKSGVLLVVIVVFINMAGFSLILPLLPFYGHELNASPVQVTMLFASYSFGNVFGELWWGRASDRYGRKRVLIITTTGAALGYVVFAFMPTLWLALLVRTLTGFFGGTFSVSQSYIADVTRPEDRPKKCGRMAPTGTKGSGGQYAFRPVTVTINAAAVSDVRHVDSLVLGDYSFLNQQSVRIVGHCQRTLSQRALGARSNRPMRLAS